MFLRIYSVEIYSKFFFFFSTTSDQSVKFAAEKLRRKEQENICNTAKNIYSIDVFYLNKSLGFLKIYCCKFIKFLWKITINW